MVIRYFDFAPQPIIWVIFYRVYHVLTISDTHRMTVTDPAWEEVIIMSFYFLKFSLKIFILKITKTRYRYSPKITLIVIFSDVMINNDNLIVIYFGARYFG